MVLQEGIALLGAELGVAKKVDPGKGGLEHDGGIYVESCGQIVAEVERRGGDGVVSLVHVHEAGRFGAVTLGRVQRGITELLHVAQGVPNLHAGGFDAVAEEAHRYAVGIEYDGAARCHEEDLFGHDGHVAQRAFQLVGQYDRAVRRLLARELLFQEEEVNRRIVALPADAHHLALDGKKAAESIKQSEESGGRGYGEAFHNAPPVFAVLGLWAFSLRLQPMVSWFSLCERWRTA